MQDKTQDALSVCDNPSSLWDLATQVALLSATGRQSEAIALATAGLGRYEDGQVDFHSAFYVRVLLPFIVHDWDDCRVLREAEKFDRPQLALGVAHYFIALQHLGENDHQAARDHFLKCVDRRIFLSPTHFWSRAFLKRLPPEAKQVPGNEE